MGSPSGFMGSKDKWGSNGDLGVHGVNVQRIVEVAKENGKGNVIQFRDTVNLQLVLVEPEIIHPFDGLLGQVGEMDHHLPQKMKFCNIQFQTKRPRIWAFLN